MSAMRTRTRTQTVTTPAGRRGEGGFTLAEVLIAVTVMAIVFVVTFSLYDSLQRSFKLSENAATQQQNTRVAFDRMVADIRMAGFNHNPDGDPNRPDEQIEGMWDQAIALRGDFDFEDATARLSPETTLGGSGMPFRVVSIGNDEIVAYGLAKSDGSGGTNISYVADVVGVPRNGSQETVTVSNVHLTQSAPPYTLYRYFLSPNSTTVVKQPVADNIRSMGFTYYDGAGNVLTSAGGAEDPNSIAQRERISKIGINVVGMTEDPDLAYIDPTDPNGLTQHYRKFTLQTDVTPRNLKLEGVVDIDLDDPNAPTNFTACQGHCDGTYLKWQSGGDPDVSSYTVSWGTSVSFLTNVISTGALNFYVSSITGPHYYAVRSVDMVGNQSGNVILGPSTPTDTTTPAQVTGVACTGDAGNVRPPVDSQVNITWAGISGNTTNLGCDDPPYPIRDLRGYRVYKGTSAGFDPNNVSQVVQSWDPNSVPATVNALSDGNVVNCRPYYYKVRGEDLCAKPGAVSAVADGSSTTNIPPAAPSGLMATDMGQGLHRLTWNRVTQNTAPTPAPILIDKYAIYRAVVPIASDPNQASYTQVFSGLVGNPAAPSWDDPSVPNIPAIQAYYYRVSALDDCPNESAQSLPDEAERCNFGGTISMNVSPGGPQLTGNQTITLTASGPPIQGTSLVVREMSSGTVVFTQTDATAPYVYTWNASSVSPGFAYEIIGMVTNNQGCTESISTVVTTVVAIACCITPNNPTLTPVTGALKNNEVFFDVINNCGDDVLISGLDISFTNNRGQGSLLDEVEYNVLDALTTGRTFNLSPDLPSIAVLDFTVAPLAPELSLLKNNDITNPVRLRYKFTQEMLRKVGCCFVGETIRTNFAFAIASQSGAGRCDITVVTNPLSVVICDPASDPFCVP